MEFQYPRPLSSLTAMGGAADREDARRCIGGEVIVGGCYWDGVRRKKGDGAITGMGGQVKKEDEGVVRGERKEPKLKP